MAEPAARVTSFDYLRDPDEIYRRSFELIEQELDLQRFPVSLRPAVRRIVHACGMPQVAGDLAWSGDPVGAAKVAISAGTTILCDSNMVAAGLIRCALPNDCDILCTLDAPDTKTLSEKLGTTRSAAAVELWRKRMRSSIVVIGNAPTALFHLLERLEEWPERPAAIFAFPVGFVGAAESKDALISCSYGIPYLTLRGRCGGSAIAAAAINSLSIETP